MTAAAAWPGYFHRMAVFSRSVEGSLIYYTSNLGGSTVFACGNMIRNSAVEKRLSLEFGMTGLSECFDEAIIESSLRPLPIGMMSESSRRLMEQAVRLGYDARPVSKGIVPGKTCDRCGRCMLGCHRGVKWDSRRYLVSTPLAEATVRTRSRVDRLLIEGGRVAGVVVNGKERIGGGTVVLAAGAMNTPLILQKSGIDAGIGLFVDYFKCLYGTVDDSDQLHERTMSFVIDKSQEHGFIISPFIDDRLQYLLFCPRPWRLSAWFPRKHALGLMVKIADERSGRIETDGRVHKRPTRADRIRMEKGLEVAFEILRAAGARNQIATRVWRGAHPGGTAAIGEVIDNNLRVQGLQGLYVCDASALPFAPGLPPILTITAMGKWLGKRI